ETRGFWRSRRKPESMESWALWQRLRTTSYGCVTRTTFAGSESLHACSVIRVALARSSRCMTRRGGQVRPARRTPAAAGAFQIWPEIRRDQRPCRAEVTPAANTVVRRSRPDLCFVCGDRRVDAAAWSGPRALFQGELRAGGD